jgi:nucleoside-diphosphate-sugar epimerase
MKRDLRFVTVPHAFSILALRGERFQVHASGVLPLGFIHLADAVDALLAAPAPGYAPANAVGEILSAVGVAETVRAAARARGLSVEIALPDEYTPRAPFAVSSRLTATGWRARRTLAQTVPDLLEYYAQ